MTPRCSQGNYCYEKYRPIRTTCTPSDYVRTILRSRANFIYLGNSICRIWTSLSNGLVFKYGPVLAPKPHLPGQHVVTIDHCISNRVSRKTRPVGAAGCELNPMRVKIGHTLLAGKISITD